MKRNAFLALCITGILVLTLLLSTACTGKSAASVTDAKPGTEAESAAASSLPPPVKGNIYLYGEQHGVDKIIDKEYALWSSYYHEQSMRRLFMELPYFTAEFLNAWMQEESNEILDAVYDEWAGTSLHNPKTKEFFETIKRDCPETVFVGTDVGHQYDTTGARFLRFLEENGEKNAPQYALAQENIEQGKRYRSANDAVYRENAMSQNFFRAFDALNGESVMGIYGAAHTDPEAMDYATQTISGMAKQLQEKYGDALYTEDLSWMAKDIDPLRMDSIKVNGKVYKAAYFGKTDISSFSEKYKEREVWRLENAYDDFQNAPMRNNVLPREQYPMLVGEDEVFVWDYIAKDGTVNREYHRTTDTLWQGRPITQEFVAK